MPGPKAIETGKSSSRSYTRFEGVSPEDQRIREMRARDAAAEEQMGRKALTDLQQQRMDQSRAAKEAEAYEGAKQPYRPSFKKGGGVGSASKRADGVAKRGKTKGRFV